MKLKRMRKTGLVLLIPGMILVMGGVAVGQPSAPGTEGSRFIQKFDQNGDGKVSKEEFPGPEDHFTDLDANEDGFIDQSEAPKGPPHGMKGGGFIQKFDKDGDGKVSEAEFTGPKNHFANLDANGDGFIDQSEAPKGPPMK